MKIVISSTITTLIFCGCQAQPPEIFEKKEVTPALLAKAVNHFVAQGEDASVKELKQLASKGDCEEEIGWVCRILFQPKGNEPLRDPGYGGLFLPYNSMPLKNWPVFPLVKSGDSYFVLAQGRNLAGLAETSSQYIHYCQTNGVFLKTSVHIPSREKAITEAKELRNSSAWKAIKWTLPEEWTWKYINRQAEAIP